MKYLKNNVLTILLGLFLIGLSSDAFAQDKQAAFKAYNKALELAKNGQYEQAINMFNQAISLAEEMGPEGKDIVQRAQNQLPPVYYQSSLAKYKDFQKQKTLESLDVTIESFRQTSDIAKEYNVSEIASKADQVITQLLYAKAVQQFRTEDYQGSLASLNQAISRDPNYAKAYYQKGVVAKKQEGNSLDEILNFFDKAIEVGNKTNDAQTVRQAKESAGAELIYRGSSLIQEKNYDEAISLLNRALEYLPNSADAYYRLAEAYNKQAEWDQALENAQKALQYETGGTTDKAKIYYELGTAYKGLGNKTEACNAYKNAAYGQFKSPAEHQMEFELKCDSATN